MRRDVLFIQEISMVYASLSLKTDQLKMADLVGKDTEAFEKRNPRAGWLKKLEY